MPDYPSAFLWRKIAALYALDPMRKPDDHDDIVGARPNTAKDHGMSVETLERSYSRASWSSASTPPSRTPLQAHLPRHPQRRAATDPNPRGGWTKALLAFKIQFGNRNPLKSPSTPEEDCGQNVWACRRCRAHSGMKRWLKRPPWWASSAVPYPFFWLVPTAGAAVGYVAAHRLGVPVWSGFGCAELPALALEAWWRYRRPTST